MQVKDIERLMMKISSGYATPRDLMALHHSFAPIGSLTALLAPLSSPWIQEEAQKLDPLPANESTHCPGAWSTNLLYALEKGKFLEMDFIANSTNCEKSVAIVKLGLPAIKLHLREQTGIKTLKVGFNKMFGYYIEVSRGQTNRMPDTFLRRQTLVNAERYISPALKEYESKVLTAEERIQAIESELFQELRQEIAQYAKAVMNVAQAIARIDCSEYFGRSCQAQSLLLPYRR